MSPADAAARDPRHEFYERIAPLGFAPLWEVLKGIAPPEPRPTAQAQLWRWRDARPLLMQAGILVGAAEAVRRALLLENPAYPGKPKATATLTAAIQLVLPGEIAPAHRHTQTAVRFVLESDGGFTAVAGERTAMRAGDFVITPSWTFHDHGNEGGGPLLFLDVLDTPIAALFEAGFAESHAASQQPVTRPEGDAAARFGAGLLPLERTRPFGLASPLFSYPYRATRAALVAAAQGGPPDPHLGLCLRHANPLDGGWATPSIASWMIHLPPGFATLPVRSTDGLLIAVAEGDGTAELGAARLAFGPRDIFVAPNWSWRRFAAGAQGCILFVASDRAAQEKLGLWREERKAAP